MRLLNEQGSLWNMCTPEAKSINLHSIQLIWDPDKNEKHSIHSKCRYSYLDQKLQLNIERVGDQSQ